jgi:transcriptional regulator with XRE-family HTH domain
MKIGEKLKNYRQRAGYSQMDLEIAIDAAFGSMSRIENNKVNPTKETLISIAKTIGMSTNEIADLFGINLSDESSVLDLISSLHEFSIQSDLENYIVNDFTLKLGYLGSLLIIDEGDTLRCKALTANNISSVTFDLLKKYTRISLTDLKLSKTRHSSNIVVQSVATQNPRVCYSTAELGAPVMPDFIGNMIQKHTGDKIYGIYPITHKKKSIGAIAFAKKVMVDFGDDDKILGNVVKQVGLALNGFCG